MQVTSSMQRDFAATMQRLGGFEKKPLLAIAVSGGADSMALMLLAHTWARAQQGRIIAITVNHGLRPEAATEADLVAHIASKHGIEHHMLTITLKSEQSNLQATARKLRYEALENFCHQHHILHLLTAHHADDQIETLARKCWRNGDVSALLGIPQIRFSKHCRIVRPLLHNKKQELVDWLTHKNIAWAEDASNLKHCYERNRLRHYLSMLPIDHHHTLELSAKAAFTQETTNHLISELAINSIIANSEGYITLSTQNWHMASLDHLFYLIRAILYSLGKEGASPRSKEINNLVRQLTFKSGGALCLAGLQFISTKNNDWLVIREMTYCQAPITLSADKTYHWDGRFVVKCGTLEKPYILAPIGNEGALQLKKLKITALANLPRPALLAIPAIWHLDQLCFLPHINMSIGENKALPVRLTQRWRMPLFGSSSRYITF